MPAPTPATRGILIAPTIFGNVLVGPTAEEVDDRDDRSVTEAGLAQLRHAMAIMAPSLADQPVNTIFAGMRPATQFRDYQIISRLDDAWVTVAGIRSTGLSASLGIAEHVAGLLIPQHVRCRAQATPSEASRVPDLSEPSVRPWADAARTGADPAYAEMVCHCERISLGEIRDALASPLAAADSRRIEAPHPRHVRALPGLLLRGARAGPARRPDRDAMTMPQERDPQVLIVGAGPAGLAAARALVERGVSDILVIDRDDAPGGLPRFCHHPGFGLEYARWPYSGPGFVKHLLDRLAGSAIRIECRTTLLALRRMARWRRSSALHSGIASCGRARSSSRPASANPIAAT